MFENFVPRLPVTPGMSIVVIALVGALSVACSSPETTGGPSVARPPAGDAGAGAPILAPGADGGASTDMTEAGPEIDITALPPSAAAPPLDKCITHVTEDAVPLCPSIDAGPGTLNFSPDGRSLATAGPGWVDVWSVTPAGLVAVGRIKGIGTGQVRGAFSPDGAFIATLASSSGVVQLYSFPGLAMEREFLGLQPVAGTGAGVGFSADGSYVIASDGRTVRSWSSSGSGSAAPADAHILPAARPRAFVISPRAALSERSRTGRGWVAFDDPILNQVVLLNLDTGARAINQFSKTVLSLAFSADGSELAAGLIGKRTALHVVGGEIVRMPISEDGQLMGQIGSYGAAGREALDLSYSQTNGLLVGVFGTSAGTGLPGEGDGFIQIFSHEAPRVRAGSRLPAPGGTVAFAKNATVVAFQLTNDCARVTICQQ